MPIKTYKPTSAGRRFSSVNAYAELTTNKPEKSLIERRKKPKKPARPAGKAAAPKPGNVVNIMDALRQSIATEKGRGRG